MLTQCAEYFARVGDAFGEALVLASLALAQLTQAVPDLDGADVTLRRALRLVEELDDAFGRAIIGNLLGRTALMRGRTAEAIERFDASLAIARRIDDKLGLTIALNYLGWARVMLADVDGAAECFSEQLLISSTVGHEDGIAYALEGLFALAALSGDLERAGRLLGAAEEIRESKGLFAGAAFSFHQRVLDRVEDGPGAADFAAAQARGPRRRPRRRRRAGAHLTSSWPRSADPSAAAAAVATSESHWALGRAGSGHARAPGTRL